MDDIEIFKIIAESDHLTKRNTRKYNLSTAVVMIVIWLIIQNLGFLYGIK